MKHLPQQMLVTMAITVLLPAYNLRGQPPPTGTAPDRVLSPTGTLGPDQNLRPQCPQPAQALSGGNPGASPSNKIWQIHAKGVGDIWPGDPVPESIDALEGRPYDEAFKKAVRGRTHHQAMAQGYFDQEGFALIKLSRLDLVLRMTSDQRVLGIYPGPGVRTAQGTGMGSTLAELKRAHGSFTLGRIPEPHRCVARVPGLDKVYFYYADCAQACAGQRAVAVYIEGGNYDYNKNKWVSPPSKR